MVGYNWLVVSAPLKNIMGRIFPYIMEIKKCLKPPTRCGLMMRNGI